MSCQTLCVERFQGEGVRKMGIQRSLREGKFKGKLKPYALSTWDYLNDRLIL